MGNTARSPEHVRSIASLSLSQRPGATPPAGQPGVRNFPRVRQAAPIGECHRSVAVAKYLARKSAAERAQRRADERAAAAKGRKGKNKERRPWSRPGEDAPGLAHSPAAARPAVPMTRDAGARAHELAPWAARRNAFMRREHARVQPARPRPSRALAELVAEATT